MLNYRHLWANFRFFLPPHLLVDDTAIPNTRTIKYGSCDQRYHNPQGRQAIVDASRKIHHDFSELNGTLAISILPEDLEELKRNEGVEWFEGDGKVIYCTIR